MAFEVFDDVAFYWFLMSCTVAFVIPITYSFLSTLKWRRPDDWTRKLGSCKEKMSRNDKDARAEQLAALLGWRGMGFVVGWLLLLVQGSRYVCVLAQAGLLLRCSRCMDVNACHLSTPALSSRLVALVELATGVVS